MKVEEELFLALKQLFKAPIQTFPATVLTIDMDELTCDVQPIDGPEIFGVRLKAAVTNVTDGMVQIPKLNTSVLCGLIGNDDNTCVVLAIDEVDQTLFNGGSKGGLINIQTLIENLNKTNDVVNAIKNSLLNWTVTPSDGGAALKAYATTQLAGKVVGDFSAMEDTKVKH